MTAIGYGRTRQALFGAFACAAAFAVASRSDAQQVTFTIGYPPSAQQAPTVVAAPSSSPAPPYGPYGRAGIAQAVAYAQYLQYVQAMNYAAARGGSASDVVQYFTNGASATTVPSAGQPGAAYFANGAEATVLRPPPPPSAAPAPSSSAPPPPAPQAAPYPWPFVPAPPQGPPTARAAEAAPAPSVTAAVTESPPPTGEVVEAQPASAPVAAMSFEQWLDSMGISVEQSAPPPAPQETSTSVTEPSALASGSIQRASYAPREKLRHRPVDSGGSGLLAAVGAFGAGLLLGGLAVMRLRRRASSTAQPSVSS